MIDPDTISHESILGVTAVRHAHTSRGPEEKLCSALFQRAKVDGMTAAQAAEHYGLGDDSEVIAYIQSLLDRQLLDNPSRMIGKDC